MGHTDRHDDNRAGFGVDVISAGGEAHPTCRDDECLVVLVMHVLRRLRGTRWKRRHDDPQAVSGVCAVFDYSDTNWTGASLFTLLRTNHINTHQIDGTVLLAGGRLPQTGEARAATSSPVRVMVAEMRSPRLQLLIRPW